MTKLLLETEFGQNSLVSISRCVCSAVERRRGGRASAQRHHLGQLARRVQTRPHSTHQHLEAAGSGEHKHSVNLTLIARCAKYRQRRLVVSFATSIHVLLVYRQGDVGVTKVSTARKANHLQRCQTPCTGSELAILILSRPWEIPTR